MNAARRYGWPAALFALKCLAAAALAFYVSLRIGLERPYWAFLTSFIVAQPLAGAVISKAFFRIIGTIAGATMTVIMVPTLVNAPELLSLAFASWLGLCVFISILDRTPRAYMFVLAGYSACIIGLPSVDIPDQIFNIAILRVQEISVGIVCGTLVHGIILPGSVTSLLLSRVRGILRDAERWSRDAIAVEPVENLDAERLRLAQDVTELHQLSIHLPFDISRLAPRVRTIRAMQDQLSLLLPLGAAVQDRLVNLRREGGVPREVATLIADAQAWLNGRDADRAARADTCSELQLRCAAIEPPISPDMPWRDMLLLSLASRLSELMAVHRDCRDLLDQIVTHSRQPVTPRVAELLEGRRNRELHRDYTGALRGAISAFLTITVGSALWIGSEWRDGGTAVMTGGFFLALFSASDNPVAPLKTLMLGTLIASIVGAIYGYAILPRLDGYPMFVAAFAPAILVGGSLLASPKYSGLALGSLLGLGSPALIADHYVDEFATFANAAIAQLVGLWFAIAIASLLQSAGAQGAIRRTVRAGWNDLATRSIKMTPPDLRGWINRMLDRIALLEPRLAALGNDSGLPLYNALRDLRTGVAVGELRQLRLDLPGDQAEPLADVLQGVSSYYGKLDPDDPQPATPALLNDIDGAIGRLSGNASLTARRAGTLALVSLRRNLFPEAPAYRRLAA
ncbi:MAG: FUSC family protein [Sphingomonas sanxanigenens]|uniref:FUSC family protein n=1 Tax=Sphingomonas sanxanigenens TaxID=397260 RepID=A0A2W5C947_9SPHN|nr:MAG: FUSC family protein [Sphingomonas sanxanigenens]